MEGNRPRCLQGTRPSRRPAEQMTVLEGRFRRRSHAVGSDDAGGHYACELDNNATVPCMPVNDGSARDFTFFQGGASCGPKPPAPGGKLVSLSPPWRGRPVGRDRVASRLTRPGRLATPGERRIGSTVKASMTCWAKDEGETSGCRLRVAAGAGRRRKAPLPPPHRAPCPARRAGTASRVSRV
jgi:hypothetical protein